MLLFEEPNDLLDRSVTLYVENSTLYLERATGVYLYIPYVHDLGEREEFFEKETVFLIVGMKVRDVPSLLLGNVFEFSPSSSPEMLLFF